MNGFFKQLKDSDLFKGAAKSKIKPNAIVALIIFFTLWGVPLLAGRWLLTPLLQLLPEATPLQAAFAASLRKLLLCGLQIAAFFTWAGVFEKRGIITMGFEGKHRFYSYVKGALLGLGAISLIVLALVLLGAFDIRPAGAPTLDGMLIPIFVAMLGWVIQSASEEIAVRGWLIPAVGTRYGPLCAVLLTGCAFGAIHLFNAGVTLLSFINLTLSGFFFALYAINSGNIWGVCGLHMGWNFAQGNIFGVSISGERSANILFACEKTGSDLLTGGDFGPEGGLIATGFLFGGNLILGMLIYRKQSNLAK